MCHRVKQVQEGRSIHELDSRLHQSDMAKYILEGVSSLLADPNREVSKYLRTSMVSKVDKPIANAVQTKKASSSGEDPIKLFSILSSDTITPQSDDTSAQASEVTSTQQSNFTSIPQSRPTQHTKTSTSQTNVGVSQPVRLRHPRLGAHTEG